VCCSPSPYSLELSLEDPLTAELSPPSVLERLVPVPFELSAMGVVVMSKFAVGGIFSPAYTYTLGRGDLSFSP